MKKLLFSAAAAALLFTACKKDDDKTSSDSYVKINNNIYATPYGYNFITPGRGGEIDIASTTSEKVQTSPTIKATIVALGLDTLIDGQTYTYVSNNSGTYDKTKNFNWADVTENATFNNGEQDDNTGKQLSSPTNGTITVKKSGTTYTFVYNLKYANDSVSGKFVGNLIDGQ
jgi:hypothetical protein